MSEPRAHLHRDVLQAMQAALFLFGVRVMIDHPRATARLLDAAGQGFTSAIRATLGLPPAPWHALDDVTVSDEAGELLNVTGFDLHLVSQLDELPHREPISRPRTSGGGFRQWRHLPRTRRPGAPYGDDADYFGEDRER